MKDHMQDEEEPARPSGLSLGLVRTVIDLLGPRKWTKISVLLALTLIASSLEVLGIGIFLPYISVVSDPEALLNHEAYGPIVRSLGIVDRNGLILGAGLGLLAVFTLKNAYLALHWQLVTRLIYREIHRLSTELFAAYLRSPYLFHVSRNSSRLIRNVSGEVREVFRSVLDQGVRLVVESLVFLGAVAVLIFVNPFVALGGLVFLGMLALGIERIARHRIGALGDLRVRASGERYQWLQQGLGAVKEIRILGRGDYFVRKFAGWDRTLLDTLREAALAGQYPRLALEMGAVVFLVAVITLTMLSGSDLDAILGTLVVFGVAIVRLLPAVSKITVGLNQVRFSAPSVYVVAEEFEELERIKGSTSESLGPPVLFHRDIVIERLHYRYPSRREWAVEEVTLTIKKGESVGFSGESGGGKTTLLHLLSGLLHPTSGRILVDGRDIAENMASWQRALGYVSQEAYLLDDTIRRNVAFGLPDEQVNDDAVWSALERAQLADTIRQIGLGLNALIGERGVGLSGGQRQRLAIARALYHDPSVLVFDEPTSALDPDTERELGRTIMGLKGSKTMLMVSHRPETLQGCHTVYVLEGGRIVDRVSSALTEVEP